MRLIGLLTGALLIMGSAMENVSGEEAKKGEVAKALQFELNSIKGESVKLEKYSGKVILVVNVASKCGYTRQYADLQSIYKKYGEKGLVILGIPCNQFGRQEPGSSKEIAEFCDSEFGVTFDLFEKVDVNGENACDFYKHLTSLNTEPTGKGDVKWNFEKFLIGRDGKVVGRYKSGTNPSDEDFVAIIEKLLAAK